MKLSDIRTTAKEQLEKGKEIRDELDRRNEALETAQSERDSRYDDMASGLEGRKAVEIGGVHVIKSILAATDIKGVAVGEKRFTAQFTHIICDNLRVLRTQMGKIAEFAEVNLNGSVLVLKMDLLKAGLFHKPVQLLG